MSFRLGLTGIQELLVVALMIIFVFAIVSNIELTYKIGLGAIVFALIFLTTVASQVLKQAEERNKR